jgi:hypothetical protein
LLKVPEGSDAAHREKLWGIMSDTWIRELLQQNAEIVEADQEVTVLLHRLRVLHQAAQDKSEAAGLLVTKLKRLLRLRDQRDRDLQR